MENTLELGSEKDEIKKPSKQIKIEPKKCDDNKNIKELKTIALTPLIDYIKDEKDAKKEKLKQKTEITKLKKKMKKDKKEIMKILGNILDLLNKWFSRRFLFSKIKLCGHSAPNNTFIFFVSFT